jgi:hypothetical protein
MSIAGEPKSLLAGKAPAGLGLAWDRLRSSIPAPDVCSVEEHAHGRGLGDDGFQ